MAVRTFSVLSCVAIERGYTENADRFWANPEKESTRAMSGVILLFGKPWKNKKGEPCGPPCIIHRSWLAEEG